MGGGKSRALCEDVLRDALLYQGIQIVIFRNTHVSLRDTTKKTMMNETIPPELLRYCTTKQSMGEDWVRLPNGSEIHFGGLDDPVRWFSSNLGGLAFDEAHEISEDAVVQMNTRLRQVGMPHKVRIGFNPENPGHWLYRWFIAGADKTDNGYYKPELLPTDAVSPIGDAEFVFAKAADNPYLPDGYIDRNLGGLPEMLRRRYLDGEWLFVTGTCFFDQEALIHYETTIPRPTERVDFVRTGYGEQATIKRSPTGRTRIYQPPEPGAGYAIGADVATGRGQDYSAGYVVNLADMHLAAEFRHKIDPDLFAEQLHFLGRWYNTALIAVESAGGFGEPVIINLRDGKGGRPAYPRLYRHQLDSNVDLSLTQRYGYPMSTKTRPLVLNALERAIRDRDLLFLTESLWNECQTFVHADTNPSPRAQDGCNDDCVMAAAITLEMYRKHGSHPDRDKRLANRNRQRRRGRSWYERLHGTDQEDMVFDENRYQRETSPT